jgi:hypothetical protein
MGARPLKTRKTWMALCLFAVGLVALTVGRAGGASGTKSSYQVGPAEIPKDVEASAMLRANGFMCTEGTLSSIASEASTTWSSFAKLEPRTAASLSELGADAPVYAAFVEGSCVNDQGDGVKASTLVGARVVFTDEGLLTMHAWFENAAPDTSVPFGDQYEPGTRD